jgi:nucleoside-diphosphate-sugar epimerase
MQGSMTAQFCVSGAGGFVGTHLLESLRGSGVPVTTLSRRAAPSQGSVVRGDLLDPASLKSFVQSGSIVVHLAYMGGQPAAANLQAAKNLAEACRSAGVRRLIHCSTAVVVGTSPEDVVVEETPCEPRLEYERTKLSIEREILGTLAGVCEVVVLRPTAVFGRGGRNLLNLIRRAREWPHLANRLAVAALGHRALNLVAVENVVGSIRFAATMPLPRGEETFLVSDDEWECNDYVGVMKMVHEGLGLKPLNGTQISLPRVMLKAALRARGRTGTNPARRYSCAKLLQAGFKKPVPFPEAVARFCALQRSMVAAPGQSSQLSQQPETVAQGGASRDG